MERKSQNENLFFWCEGICLRNDTEFYSGASDCHISHEANACKWSISSPFFVTAPACWPRFINMVSSGL